MTTDARHFLLTVEDIASELNVSPQRVRDLFREGTIPRAFRHGKRWYILKRDWVRHIERMAKNGGFQ